MQEWGEDQFIQFLRQQFPAKEPIVGIGDDCAVIPTDQGQTWLVTTDALVEGVHFLTDQISAFDLGYKTVAVNVSDIAAMGGEPKYAFLAIALPKSSSSDWVRELVLGIKQACQKWDVQLLGGDTNGAKRDLFLNLTLIGTAAQSSIKYRHSACAGDLICVTGHLGDSGAGRKVKEARLVTAEDTEYLVHAHFHPEPSPEQGQWLARHSAVHAMIDLSDGLDCDLRRLIRASNKGAVVELTQVPLSPQLLRVCRQQVWDPLEFALTGGEDYSLLFTAAAEPVEELKSSFQKQFGSPLYLIGSITEQQPLIYFKGGQELQMQFKSFNHFI